MKRYGNEFTLMQELLDIIATYMDDDIREQVYAEFAPCKPENFLKIYCELDEDFENLLWSEFGIVIE